jgi:hypothetical protein
MKKKYFCDKCKPSIRKLLEYTKQSYGLVQEAELMLQDLKQGEIEEENRRAKDLLEQASVLIKQYRNASAIIGNNGLAMRIDEFLEIRNDN